jgi:integrase
MDQNRASCSQTISSGLRTRLLLGLIRAASSAKVVRTRVNRPRASRSRITVWREMRDSAEMDGLVSHMLRKTVASFLDDARVSTRKISDQVGHSQVSMAQDRYLGRRLTDRQTAEVLEDMFPEAEDPEDEDPEAEDPGKVSE